MKKLFAVVFIAAVITSCNSNAGSSANPDSSSTRMDSGSSPGAADATKVRMDTTSPGTDSNTVNKK